MTANSIRWCDACPPAQQCAGLYPVGRIWLCVDHHDQANRGSDGPSEADSWAIKDKLRKVEAMQSAARDAHAELQRQLVAVTHREALQRAEQLHCSPRRQGNLMFEATPWATIMDGEYSFVGVRRTDAGAPSYWLAVWQLVRRGPTSKPKMFPLGGDPPPEVDVMARREYVTRPDSAYPLPSVALAVRKGAA